MTWSAARRQVKLAKPRPNVADQMIIVALVITADGVKVPVGLRLGDTENMMVGKDLLADLVDRGPRYEQGILTVLDGAKALRRAVAKVFGTVAKVGVDLSWWTPDSGGRPRRKEARVGRPAKSPSEFRREAIALVKSSGRPVAEVAGSLSITPLRRPGELG
ncbi:MAG: transposase, partial [Actinomycetota bacterium]